MTTLSSNYFAQQFQTGSNAGGYTLSEIVVSLATASSTFTPAFAIHRTTTDSSSREVPGTEVVGLTGSVTAPDLQSFTPDSATTLSASTKYFVVFKGTSSGTNPILQQASSGTVDPGFATGWEIPVGVLNSTDSGSTWSVRISSQSYKIQIKGTAVGGTTNTAPTAADKTVTTGEDRAYAFTADDFGFADDDAGATLASVTIVTTPALGTLALDGTAVMADDVVTTAQIDGDMLTFTPARDAHGDPYTTFTFTVNDGTDDSASAYTMTIDVTDAPAPVCGVPDIAGAGRRQIWTGTVTVERFEGSGFFSYGFAEGLGGTLLPSQSFFIGSNSYVIDSIAVPPSGSLHFSLEGFSALTSKEGGALRLHVCDGDYDFNTADESENTTTWLATTLDWSPPVESRTVYLSLPANNDATGEPTITGTAQAGQELTADASPIMDADGVPSSFTYQWVRVDADGLSNPADITDATAATYTLTAADAGKKIKVQVSFTDELSGEEERTSAAYPSSGTVTTVASTTAPALLSVTVTSTPRKTTDTYGAREHIEFSMTFDAPVTVTGDPTFAFDLGGASTASYYAGSGTTTLRFSHAVSGGSSGDQDTNGISWAANAIALNGGTIEGTDNAVAAVLTHVAQSNLADHKVDGRTTAVTPATVTVAVTSTPTSLADTYGFGETIVITVTVSEAVEVVGDPVFRFSLTDMGGAANDVLGTYDGTRSSPTTIVFTYTVQAGDRDNNGIWIGDHSRTFLLDVNDRIRTASQQIDIDRSHPEKGTHADHKVNGSLGAPTVPPDPTPPTLVSATATTLTIEWTHPGDGGSPLTRNFIEYRVEGTTDWTNWYRGETPTPVTRAVIRNLAAATAYDVRVHSRNAIGNSQWTQSATAFSTLAGTAATGAPTISGTLHVGRTQTASPGTIADANGLTNASYSYQWVRVDADGTSNEEDITDATDATYTLTADDRGKKIKVRASFTDDEGNAESRTSAPTAIVEYGDPPALGVVVGVGQVVLWWKGSSDGGLTLSHYEYRYSEGEMISPTAMWQQVQTPGSIRPNQAYFQQVTGLTSGTTYTFQVRAATADAKGAPATVTATPLSQPSCTIDELGDRRLLWQGQLTAGVREITPDGNIETGYGDGGVEPGTLTPDAFTFRLTSYSVYPRTHDDLLNVVLREQDIDLWHPREEVVDALRLHVCNTPYDFSSAMVADVFTIFAGYRWNVGSNWPAGIERTLRLSLPPNHAATGDPVISGTVQVGAELTALTDGIMDDDVLDDVFTYQWVRVDADGTSNEEDITDETDATYTLTDDERGKQVKVEVRFVDILGGEETRTSAPTATLAGVPNTAATGAPTITGTAQVGQTLTAVTTGIMDADGLTSPTYTYQWIRVDGTEADIAGENSSTYTLVDADLGTTLKVKVTFDDDASHTETLTSAATATVGAAATGPPTVTDVAVTSTPASGTTYYLAGEVIEFTVTFSAPVTVTGTPKFAFRLGAATRQAAYASGSDSVALVFARTVQAGEVDRNGISWNALALALDGGTITQTGATTAARLTHAEQAPLEGHRVDAAPPMQVSASVQGLSLVLVYDEALDPASMPATGAYTVTATVGATTTNPAVSAVSIYGIWVTLTLDAAPAAGATVTLAYAPLASNPVQDEAGNDAPVFSGQSVRLGAPVTPPGAPQNLSWVLGDEQVTLSWDAPSSDGGAAITRYEYAIDASGTWIDAGLDLQETVTGLTNGQPYTFAVRAVNAAGDGPATTVTATPVTTPGAPQNLSWVLGDEQVTLSWDAPSSDGGAAITRYEYAIDDSGTWIDADLDLQETVPDLTNGQPYTFAVRAVNAEGDSPAATVTATPVTTPGAPENLGWAPGDGQVTLTWDAPSSDGGAAITRYEYAIDASGTWIDADLDLQETVPDLTNGQPYTFAVRAVNAAGGSPATTVTATPVTTPGAPQNLSWTPGDEQATLTWDAPSSDGGAAITRYEYAIDASGTWIDAGLDLQETVPDLTNGQPYTFAVRAVNAAGDGPAATVTATPVTTPGVPENLGWAPGDAQVTLTWDAPSSDGGAAITRYEYEIDASGTWIDADLDLQETVPDLANGQPYTFAVRAVNAAGDGPATTVTATPVTTPGAPQNLSWVAGYEQVTLNWDAPASDGGAAIARYEYEIDASGTWIDADLDLQETVPDLANGQPYTFAVRAVNAAGDGPATTVTATPVTTPGAPQNLSWAPGDGQVTLSWDAPASDGGAAITGYEYAIDDNGTWIDAGTDRRVTVSGLTNGQPYTFAVRAVNAVGGGDAATVTATPVTTPGAPQNLSWAPGDGQVTLTWDAPSSDGGAAITRYEYAIDDSGTWIDAGLDLQETVPGLTNGQPYTFAVRAVNAVGGGDVATVTATPVTTPGAPQNLSWVAGYEQVTLNWDAPASDGGAAITGYEYAIDDNGTWIDAGTDRRVTVSGLTNGQPYTFAVRAVNAVGGGDAATVTATPVTTPGAPQNLSGVPGNAQVTLSWDAPASDGGSAITGYEYAIDDNGTWIDAGTDRRVTVSGLTNGQPYTFAVRAVNAVGGGDAATVTIVSADPLPQAWLARFGRAAADHVVEAVSDRWRGGPPASHVTIGGRQAGDLFGWTGLGGQAERDTAADRGDLVRTDASSTRRFAPFGNAGTGVGGTGPGMTVSAHDMNRAPVGLGGVDRETGATLGGHAAQGALLGAFGLPDPRALTDLGALLMGSSFSYSGAREEDGRARTPGWLGEWSAWGRAATSRFSGADGELSLDGEVATAMLGFDSRWRRWLAGVVVSHSGGEGAYTHPTATSGAVASSLTALHPYVHFALNERTNFWSVLGYGVGRLSLKPERSATALKTDLTNTMAAFGGRMSVRSARAGRFELAILSDARLTNTASAAAAGLAGAVGRTSRVRMMLEGSGSMPLAAGGMLKPTLEAGLRYDAGDAETGAGLEVGGGLGYAAGRLSVEVGARGLLAHQDTEYEEWGFSGSIAYTPSADGRGLSTRIGSAWGATQSGVQSLWSRQDASGLVRNTAFDGAQRYQAELRYGLDGLQGRARWAPYIGVESGGRSSQALRQGVTLTLGRHFDAELELGRRRVGPVADPEHAVQLRGTLRW